MRVFGKLYDTPFRRRKKLRSNNDPIIWFWPGRDSDMLLGYLTLAVFAVALSFFAIGPEYYYWWYVYHYTDIITHLNNHCINRSLSMVHPIITSLVQMCVSQSVSQIVI
jgi:hypothetical protein